MRANTVWRKKSGLIIRFSGRGQRLSRLVNAATRALISNPRGGHWGKVVWGLINAVASTRPPLKVLSFQLRSIRRLWGSTKTIDIRLKW